MPGATLAGHGRRALSAKLLPLLPDRPASRRAVVGLWESTRRSFHWAYTGAYGPTERTGLDGPQPQALNTQKATEQGQSLYGTDSKGPPQVGHRSDVTRPKTALHIGQ